MPDHRALDDREKDYHAPRDAPFPPLAFLDGLITWVRLRLGYHLLFRVLSRPGWLLVLRYVFALIRRRRPISRIFGLVIPSRHADVCEALTRSQDFNTAEAMVPRLPMGPMLQAIDWPARHRAERQAIEAAFACTNKDDYGHLRAIVTERLDRELPDGDQVTIDVASALTEEVALDVAIRYFGIGDWDRHQQGAEREHLRHILRRLASQIFRAPPADTAEAGEVQFAKQDLHQLAEASANQITAAAIPSPKDTVLAHLLHATSHNPNPPWHTRDWAIRNAASLAVFGTATTARALTQSIYWILRKDGGAVAEDAAAAYLADPQNAKHRTALRMIALEGLRFNPMLPILGARSCLRDTALSLGTDARMIVKSGEVVLPSPLAAMFDPCVFRCPDAFRADRREESAYLHFGHGKHLCVGKRQAEIQFEETLARLFRYHGLRVLGGRRGRIAYDGPAVDRFVVTNHA